MIALPSVLRWKEERGALEQVLMASMGRGRTRKSLGKGMRMIMVIEFMTQELEDG